MARGCEGYEESAADLARRYEQIVFADLHRHTQHLFPPPGALVLDVGAGTGRDAAALAGMGHQVTAVEPTAGLREAGMAAHADAGIEWIDDSLPHLTKLTDRDAGFDLLLLTAVLMHLDVDQRETAFARFAALVRPKGRLVLSLRHGPVPDGRCMFDVSGDDTILRADRHGFDCIHRAKGADEQGRQDVTWTWLAFSRR